MEFAYIFRALMRRKWIIIACVIAAMGSAYFFTRNMKKYYKSSAQLSTGFTVMEEIKLSEENFNLPQIDVKFNNAIENITSPKVLSLLSYRMMLHDLKDNRPFTTLTEKKKEAETKIKINKTEAINLLQRKLDSIQILSPGVPEEKVLQSYIDLYDYGVYAIFKHLKVGRYQRTDYINIDYVSHNPDLSAFAVNNLCNEFKRFYGLDRQERTDVSIVTLDSLRRQKKALVDLKIQEKNKFMTSKGVLDVGMEGSNKLGQVGDFESQLIEEKANQQNLIYQVNELTRLIADAKTQGASTVKTPNASADDLEYIRLRKDYNDMNAEYIRKGANDAELKKKLNSIASQIQKLDLQSNNNSTRNDGGVISIDEMVQKKMGLEGLLKATNQKISSLQSKISELNGGLNGMAATGANIQQLDKEIEMASAEYKDANERYNLALNLNGNMSGSFKQTMVGEPALRPLATKKSMILILAGMSAFILSCLVVIGIEFFDMSIKTPSQFQRLTSLPLLGTINSVKLHNNNILEHVTLFDSKENRENIFRELIRKLRYELENSGKKIFLFTSTESSQGKTMLIQSLAFSLSLSKKRVLIIDTNFCNNDLTKSVEASPVLERFSLNGKPFDIESIAPFITKTAAEGVDMIGCEGGDYTPSEILPKNHLLNYLNQLKEEYDFIFMEGAPLNIFTDTKELVKYADGVIAVFSADANFTAADKESISFLTENKDKFLGAILNKVQEDNLNL